MLDGKVFYFATIRKLVVGFGTLFNGIKIQRTDSEGTVVNSIDVPLAYSPTAKYLSKLNNSSEQFTLPRMSYTLNDWEYDPERKKNTLGYCFNDSGDDRGIIKQLNPVPYIFNFELNVYAKHIDDALQIIEQIVPWFSPHFNITIKDVPDMNISNDVPIKLESVSYSDDYEGELELTDLRAIVYTLDFSCQGYIYKPIQENASLIKKVLIDIIDDTKISQPLLEEIDTVIEPLTANIDDAWTANTSIRSYVGEAHVGAVLVNDSVSVSAYANADYDRNAVLTPEVAVLGTGNSEAPASAVLETHAWILANDELGTSTIDTTVVLRANATVT